MPRARRVYLSKGVYAERVRERVLELRSCVRSFVCSRVGPVLSFSVVCYLTAPRLP